jgi:hypothetical protein
MNAILFLALIGQAEPMRWEQTDSDQQIALMQGAKHLGNWHYQYRVYGPRIGPGQWGQLTRQLPMGAPMIPERQVSQPAVPFQEASVADDDDPLHRLWGPHDYTLYRPAKYTQRIAVTNDRDTITPVPRTQLEAHWQVPGGLVGVSGWRSTLYKRLPGEPHTRIANLPVWNGSNYQYNRGWHRSYADESEFLDVLVNDLGAVFEVRRAYKLDGAWYRSVHYRNRSARPSGYTGTGDCVSCHGQAGSGSYAAGLVPGGDTILSDPIAGLE